MRTGRPRSFDRAQVLETAIGLFWKQGFEGTSKRDLMEATGLGSQSLYNAFGDKRSLFQEALEQYAECIFRGLDELLRADGTPLEGVRRVVRSWGEDENRGCLLANTAGELGTTDGELRDFLHAQMGRAVGMVAEALGRAQQAGELAADTDPSQLAMTLFAIRGGIALMSRSGAPSAVIEQAIGGALSLLKPS